MAKKERVIRLNDLLGLLNRLYAPQLAEDWDNVGLQVGDGAAEVRRVLVSLDIDSRVVARARAEDAQAVIAHHPLLFKPLKRIAPTDEVGRTVYAAIQAGIALVSVHTNLDRARDGLNDWLADRIGLCRSSVLLSEGDEGLYKLVVYVPEGHQEKVADALFASGAGHVGGYDCCSFRVRGQGSFRPGAGTRPFIGRTGELETVDEWRLEVILPREKADKAIRQMLKAHPYEEVAYDLLPLKNLRTDIGLGRIGELAEPVSLADFARQLKDCLQLDHLRLVGDPARKVARVAVCGGSGAFLLHQAHRQGADVLVTGDVKYHEAREAEQLGIALIDAGHFGTEKIAVEGLAAALCAAAEEKKWPIEFLALTDETDPFQLI
ncbi:dinuclear metal center YbgI/SA1388 family protein [Geothermobacter ehrlichii]|uniref:GTP cyclohydrolase 1 type 2 homolog n=1 Tax=Geothermobacter ehrlichii TaxID=213224 RepID=A0A5D3WKP6_9BACT|nr:Nif3-like dinuclear metal center hexameric protein [Geothermobacter ehrlichii]TYO98506.1 dinuclear metal center YbgI/SA1388 family protein [Geothermobacter ehrlichii]